MMNEDDRQNEVQQPQLNLGGTACDLVQIVASECAYFLRIPLPGVTHDNCKVRVNVRKDGQVDVEGLVTDCEILKEALKPYQVKVRDSVTPGHGHFCVSLKLPGPVNPRLTKLDFKSNGILEIMFSKVNQPHIVWGSSSFPHPRT